MIAPHDDPRLTAYALNDPGLSAEDRAWLEEQVKTDPVAREAIAETQRLAQSLTAAFAAEAQSIPVQAVVIPKTKAKPRWYVGGLIGGVVAASLVGIGVFLSQNQQPRENAMAVSNAEAPKVNAPDGDLTNPDAGIDPDHPVFEPDRLDKTQLNKAIRPTNLASESKPIPPVIASPSPSAPTGPMKAPPAMGGYPGPGGPPGSGAAPAPLSPSMPSPGIGGPAGGGGPPGAAGPVPGQTFTGRGAVTRERLAKAGRADRKPGEKGEDKAKQDSNAIDSPEVKKMEQVEPLGGQFNGLIENPFVKVQGEAALSTFGVDVDTASYSIVRRYLTGGSLPPAQAVRLEEMVNYFPYKDAAPEKGDPYAVRVEMADCPWQPKHRLARVSVKAQPIANDKRPPSNLVFLIDVSGSMDGPNRLPLVKASMKMLVNQLGENDRVAMVVYAGASGLVLDSTSAMNKNMIIEALDKLHAGGSTNGAGGLQQAYDVAVKNFIKNGTNRVILCTDGDWNVGTTSTNGLIELVEEKRKTGVFLSVFGFGMGNLRDEMMVKLAGKGNGNYGYIDTLREANKALVEQISGTLVTVAKDVKIQIEFNPAAIQSYRLLGYEKRILAAQDFHDDTKDAGEMGAGHVVTAFYELIPAGTAPATAGEGGLRYQPEPAALQVIPGKAKSADEAFLLKMRHKKPNATESTYREMPVPNKTVPYAQASEDFRFGAAVAEFSLILRQSEYRGAASYASVLELAQSAMKFDPSAYRAEFVDLVRMAQRLSGQK
ncbi:MAG: YfbK domain-containing protein [Fimbriiglobus sp.]